MKMENRKVEHYILVSGSRKIGLSFPTCVHDPKIIKVGVISFVLSRWQGKTQACEEWHGTKDGMAMGVQ